MEKKWIFSNSYLKEINGINYMYLREKDHYSTGLAAGNLLVQSKSKIISFFKNPFIRLFLFFIIKFYHRSYDKTKIIKKYEEELKGYSDATKIPLDILHLLNYSFDFFEKRTSLFCSTFVIFKKNNVFICRSTDATKRAAKFLRKRAKPLIMNLKIPGKTSFTQVTFPFFVGAINGINNKGIAVNSHQNSGCLNDEKISNLATGEIGRLILEKAISLRSAENTIKNNLPNYFINILVTDTKKKKSTIFEVNDKSYGKINSPKNYFACTTHFRSKSMQKYVERKVPESELRLSSIEGLLKKQKDFSIKNCIKILKNTDNGIKHEGTGRSISNEGTHDSFVLDTKNKTIYISNGRVPPVSLSGKYVKIKL